MAKTHGVVRSSIWLLLLLLWAGTGCCKATCSPNSSAGSSPTQNLMVALLAPEGPPKNIRKEPLIRAAGWVVRKLNDECAVPGYNLTFVWGETSCHPGKGMVAMTQTKLVQNAKAFIGPVCDENCWSSARLARQWNMNMVSYACGTSLLSGPKTNTYFAKTTGTYLEMGRFIGAIIRHFKWENVTLVSSTVKAASYLELLDEINRNNPSIRAKNWILDTDEQTFRHEMAIFGQQSFVFVLCLSASEARKFIEVASDVIGLYKAALITLEYITLSEADMDDNIFTGVLEVSMKLELTSPAVMQFRNEAFSASENASLTRKDVSYAILVADAFTLLAKGLAAVVSSGSDPSVLSAENAGTAINTITKASFTGLTGNIIINDDGSRLSYLVLLNIVNGSYITVGQSAYDGVNGNIVYQSITDEIIWPGGGTNKPQCPEDNCQDKNDEDALWIGVSISSVAFVIFTAVACMLLLRYRRKNRREWTITSERLYSAPALTGKVGNITGSDKKRALKMLPVWPTPASQKTEETSETGLNIAMSRDSIRTFVTGKMFAKVTLLDQQVVALKPVHKRTLEVTAAVRQEMNQVRRLKHNNVNQLVGACIEPGNICLVWLYCPKGSLADVLRNENIKVDWMFKLSFISDIARGMAYIHSSPVGVHGRLKSTNVVVDSNWCCKLTDLAMPRFRAGEKGLETHTRQYYWNLLWTAPELLRDPALMKSGTKKGDVYSFAIITHEIVTRSQPFSYVIGDRPEVLIFRLEAGEQPPFRPHVSHLISAHSTDPDPCDGVVDLMMLCWAEYPLLRPSFSIICSNLRRIRQAFGTTSNLVDQMLLLMRRYADNLEVLVEERTRQLEEEQKKTEELLSRMLPKSVAQELKLGLPVAPESYKSVTLFFSDILGFADIAAASTPIEVVNFLNDLYTCFDTIIEKYDVYKVETIADNYVVSSGLPTPNGDLHAGHIATLALDLLTHVLSFKIRHIQNKQILLRIGIHTGPVVAGVVGKKMPRYCLFGDTVNYTSRVESNGKPLHIHVSPECKAHLDKLGGFHLKERGIVEMKGKGKIKTYFLVGKEGFECVVPSLLPGIKALVGINIISSSLHSLSRESLFPFLSPNS